MPWLDDVTLALSQVVRKDGDIDVKGYLAAMDTMPPVYDILFGGIVAGQLKGDIVGSTNTVKAAVERLGGPSTLTALVQAELEAHGADIKKCKFKESGIIGLLWLNRAVMFITTFCANLNAGAETSKAAAVSAYEKILKPYHGWIAGGVVTMAMGMCPTIEDLYVKLEIADPEVRQEKLGGFLKLMEPLYSEILTLLEAHKANFPDTV